MKGKQVSITVIRVLPGLILLTAGIAKVTDFNAFVAHIALYNLVPLTMIRLVSYIIISAEITVGAVLILGYLSKGAAMLAAGLFSIFIVALVSALVRNLPIDECGCANLLFKLFRWESGLDWKLVAFDSIMLGASIIAVCANSVGLSVDSFISSIENKDSRLDAQEGGIA